MPNDLAAGPDGAMWFTESELGQSSRPAEDSKIGRVTMQGAITEYSKINPSAAPLGISVKGLKGDLWFVEGRTNEVGRLKNSMNRSWYFPVLLQFGSLTRAVSYSSFTGDNAPTPEVSTPEAHVSTTTPGRLGAAWRHSSSETRKRSAILPLSTVYHGVKSILKLQARRSGAAPSMTLPTTRWLEKHKPFDTIMLNTGLPARRETRDAPSLLWAKSGPISADWSQMAWNSSLFGVL